MLIHSEPQGLLIIGAGPAGLASLFAAASSSRLQEMLMAGVTIIERGNTLGAGDLSTCAIRSDSSAEAFLDIVMRTAEPRLLSLRAHPTTQALIALGKGDAPMALVAAFLKLAGETICAIVAASSRGRVLTETEALSLQRTSGGDWRVHVRSTATGAEYELDARAILLATGAHQPVERLHTEKVAGVALLPRFARKLMQSGEILTQGGVEKVQERLRGITNPKVVVIGGSTSAGAVSCALLDQANNLHFGPGGLTLMHRQPLRIFYESEQEAMEEGYTEFNGRDICSLTGRVFRFSGFRFTSRELVMRARQVGGRPREERLRLLHLLPERDAEALQELESADLIVAALGYRPRALAVVDALLQPISLHRPQGGDWAVVDASCRLLTKAGTPLENLYAMGLAVGPRPGAELGGEEGFKGQVNSLWMWQHMLGSRIVDQIMAQQSAGERPRRFSEEVKVPRAANVAVLGHPSAASASSLQLLRGAR